MKVNFLPVYLLAVGLLLGSQSNAVAQTTATYSSSPTGYSASIGITDTYNAGYTHSFVGFNAKHSGGSWLLGTDGSNNGGALILGEITGDLRFFTFPANYSTTGGQSFTDADIAATAPRMVLKKNGQLRIGLTEPTGTHSNYKLSVDGKLLAKSVYVTSPANWADFVFEPSYKRLPLPALEQYLQLNKHLPSIPSAKEVEANGYSLGEMDAKLLQSVEELTLYVIELSKTNEKLAARVAELERQRATLK